MAQMIEDKLTHQEGKKAALNLKSGGLRPTPNTSPMTYGVGATTCSISVYPSHLGARFNEME